MKLLSIDKLIFKGTHNSYVCETGFWGSMDWPVMNHPPHQQIADFGVWVLEFDIGAVRDTHGRFRVAVGHNGPESFSCWGYYFTDYLRPIKNLFDHFKRTFGIPHRPVFFVLDIKSKDNEQASVQWSEMRMEETEQLALSEFRQIFKDDFYLPDNNMNMPWQSQTTVFDLLGKAVYGVPGWIEPDYFDSCTSREEVEGAIRRAGHGGHLRVDQYQADWTFEYGVPPYPLFVDNTVQPPPWTITDGEGSKWGTCSNGDKWPGQQVHEQGTARFPFRSLGSAVRRVAGFTANAPQPDVARSGYGWTIFVRPGRYPESVKIAIPLTIKKDPRYTGSVTIGKRP